MLIKFDIEICKTILLTNFSSEGDDEDSQKPYFCSQGKNTDVFCEVTDSLKNVINGFFVQPVVTETLEEGIKEAQKIETDYSDVIAKIDSSFLNKEIVKNLSKEVLGQITAIPLIEPLNKIKFTKLITSDKINNHISGYKSLCTFVDNNCSDYFAEISYDYKTRTVKKKKNPWEIGLSLSYRNLFGLNDYSEPTYEWVDEAVKIPKDFYIKNDLPYDFISFKIQSRCRCITDKELVLIPFYNNTYAQFDYKYTGIEETGPIPTTWKGKKCSTDNLAETTKQLIDDFQENTFKEIKEFLDKEAGVAGGD